MATIGALKAQIKQLSQEIKESEAQLARLPLMAHMGGPAAYKRREEDLEDSIADAEHDVLLIKYALTCVTLALVDRGYSISDDIRVPDDVLSKCFEQANKRV